MSPTENPYAEEYNPYQAPAAPLEPSGVEATEGEVIRQKHLSHEASVKSVGSLYLIGGVGCIVFSIYSTLGAAVLQANPVFSAVLAGFGIAQCLVALGLRRFRGWARYLTGLLSGIGLLGFPIGTIINGYILYLLFSAKGSMVFSDKYQRIIEQTPHIEYKTSFLVKIFIALLFVVVGFAFLAALFVS